jgi:hypothetical protein
LEARVVHPSIIEARLGELKFRASRWFRAEIHELQNILMDHEKIVALACGRYFGSFALLVATDQRLLLIDKRVFFMNIEDTRYDMISEIDFNSQIYSATVTIHTINKTHKFTSIKNRLQLRDLTNYVQRRVMEFRNQQAALTDGTAVPMSQPAPGYRVRAIRSDHEPTAAAPLGAAYSYTPATSDDNQAASPPVLQSPEVAQLVGSAAIQGSHRRPFHPYIQGSLMTRRPIGPASAQTEY